MTNTINRRQMMAAAGALAGLGLSPALRSLLAGQTRPLFKIGACDWSIGNRQKLAALEEAKRIGLDGVEVSFSEPGLEYDLRDDEVRKQYLETSKNLGVEIASLAMGVLNRVPYSSDPNAEKWVEQCIDVMEKMGQKTVLLAFFSRGNLKGKPKLQAEVIRRLKKVAPKAEKAGVVLGVESTLDADEHLRILDGVGSPAVQVYYDVANMHYAGYDIYREIRRLGRERICQIHAKERGCLLGQGPIDFTRVKEALDEIGYHDWLIIEGATVKGRTTFDCYVDNQKYLRKIFPTAG
jgi:sugar phosphate isomerase/epimerase